MQPYVFPYIGYFQLINSVDTFIFYDDVHFIKRGWVNRNKIYLNNNDFLISFPCLKASQNKFIKDIEIDINSKDYSKILNLISQAYKKAPFYEDVFPLINSVFESNSKSISDFASISIKIISEYLGLETIFLYSSISFQESTGQDKADRLIDITKKLNSDHYINAIGGNKIYSKEYFKSKEISLNFIEGYSEPYQQYDGDFIPNLSIIDVVMFNEPTKVREMLNKYKLI